MPDFAASVSRSERAGVIGAEIHPPDFREQNVDNMGTELESSCEEDRNEHYEPLEAAIRRQQ